jgi:hypothetical protein
MKRLLLLLALVSSPSNAAEEATISVAINYTDYRVSPEPGPGKNVVEYTFILHTDGTVDEVMEVHGKHRTKSTSLQTLGNRFRVLDDNSLERRTESKDHITQLKIAVSGKTCRATMAIQLKPGFTEFEDFSRSLNVKAYYRDWKMTSSTCSIK